jgi:hypothetical protein
MISRMKTENSDIRNCRKHKKMKDLYSFSRRIDFV